MENFCITTKKTATLAIFEEPLVKTKSDELFETYKDDIESKIQEIIDFLGLTPSDDFFENVTSLFKTNFYRRTLTTAVEIACSTRKKYDILENVLSLLTVQMLAHAIRTEPMIEAFETALSSIPYKTALEKARYGSLIYRLEQKYQNSNILSFKKDISEKNNSCPECGCYCVCDGSCGGDVRKCTSKIALTKKCTHHCDCWIKPFVEKHKDEFDRTIKTGNHQKE